VVTIHINFKNMSISHIIPWNIAIKPRCGNVTIGGRRTQAYVLQQLQVLASCCVRYETVSADLGNVALVCCGY
jgi:hypothetical protein